MSKQSKLFAEALLHLGIMAVTAEMEGKKDYLFYKNYMAWRKSNKKIDEIMTGLAIASISFDEAVKLLEKK